MCVPERLTLPSAAPDTILEPSGENRTNIPTPPWPDVGVGSAAHLRHQLVMTGLGLHRRAQRIGPARDGERTFTAANDAFRRIAAIRSDGESTARIPLPPPPATALTNSGYPTSAARALNSSPATPTNPVLRPPSRITVGKRTGLHLSWFVYRGEGAVRFDPMQVKAWEDTRAGANSPWAPLWTPPHMPPDGKIVTSVTFSAPGTYVLRARADDGALYDDQDITITVSK